MGKSLRLNLSVTCLVDLPYKARKLPPSLNTGRTLENSLTSQQQFMWDWMRRDLPARNPHEEESGLHAEQTRRSAISVTIKAAQKRKYCTPMEFQDREGRNDSLKLEFENYLKREKTKKRKKTKGLPPLAPQLHAPEADILEEIDRAISENNDNQASGKPPGHTSNPPAGLTSLPEFIKCIAQRCTNPLYVRCLYGDQAVVHEILHEAQGKGERKYHVKWRDTIVLGKHVVMFEKATGLVEPDADLCNFP